MHDSARKAVRQARHHAAGEAIDYLFRNSQTQRETFWTGFAVATGLFYACLWSSVATGFWMTLCAVLAGLAIAFMGSTCTVRIAFAPVPTAQRWHALVPGLGALALLATGWALQNSAGVPASAGWITIGCGLAYSALTAAYVINWCSRNAPALALEAWKTNETGGQSE